MPKKKLTKAQVRKKMRSAMTNIFMLALDKIKEGSASNVTMSKDKLLDMHDLLEKAEKRVK
jgi:hypothetical protein